MLRFLLKDSRSRPSWSVTLAVPSCVAIMAKWALGGVSLPIAGFQVSVPATSASDAALLLGVWLAYIAQREYVEKCKVKAPSTEAMPVRQTQ